MIGSLAGRRDANWTTRPRRLSGSAMPAPTTSSGRAVVDAPAATASNSSSRSPPAGPESRPRRVDPDSHRRSGNSVPAGRPWRKLDRDAAETSAQTRRQRRQLTKRRHGGRCEHQTAVASAAAGGRWPGTSAIDRRWGFGGRRRATSRTSDLKCGGLISEHGSRARARERQGGTDSGTAETRSMRRTLEQEQEEEQHQREQEQELEQDQEQEQAREREQKQDRASSETDPADLPFSGGGPVSAGARRLDGHDGWPARRFGRWRSRCRTLSPPPIGRGSRQLRGRPGWRLAVDAAQASNAGSRQPNFESKRK